MSGGSGDGEMQQRKGVEFKAGLRWGMVEGLARWAPSCTTTPSATPGGIWIYADADLLRHSFEALERQTSDLCRSSDREARSGPRSPYVSSKPGRVDNFGK